MPLRGPAGGMEVLGSSFCRLARNFSFQSASILRWRSFKKETEEGQRQPLKAEPLSSVLFARG